MCSQHEAMPLRQRTRAICGPSAAATSTQAVVTIRTERSRQSTHIDAWRTTVVRVVVSALHLSAHAAAVMVSSCFVDLSARSITAPSFSES
jgi:hypothetical protein